MLGCNSQAQDLQAHYLLHLPHYLVPTFPVSWEEEEKCLWKIAGLMEDLFLGSQWSIILGYRRLSVKSLTVGTILLQDFTDNTSIQE